MSVNRRINRTFKVLLIGNVNVGKTSLLRRLTEDVYDANTIVTVGFDSKTKQFDINGSDVHESQQSATVRLQIWDTAGQERFKTVTNSYYRKAKAVILCFDICSKSSFDDLELWLRDVHNSAPQGIPIFLVANKFDMPTDEWQVELETAREWGESKGMNFTTVSAKENFNVTETFESIAQTLHDLAFVPSSVHLPVLLKQFSETDTVQLSQPSVEATTRSWCWGGARPATKLPLCSDAKLTNCKSSKNSLLLSNDATNVLKDWPAQGLAQILAISASEQYQRAIHRRHSGSQLPGIEPLHNLYGFSTETNDSSKSTCGSKYENGTILCQYGCKQRFLPLNYSGHLSECPMRLIECKLGCGKYVRASQIEVHERSYESKPVQKWDTIDVLHWIVQEIGKSNWNKMAVELHMVDGVQLLQLQEEDLQLFFEINSSIKRSNLLKQIQKLKTTQIQSLNSSGHEYQAFDPNLPQHVDSTDSVTPVDKFDDAMTDVSQEGGFAVWENFMDGSIRTKSSTSSFKNGNQSGGDEPQTTLFNPRVVTQGNQELSQDEDPSERNVELQDGRFVCVRCIKFSDIDLTNSSVVGTGSFGTVFKGHYHGATVAIKRLHAQQFEADQLLREAAVMQSVSAHPHILHFFGVILNPPNAGFVSEALSCSLDQWLRIDKLNNEEPLSEILRFACEAASGLLHLHCEKVVHRDVAARNMLLDSSLPRRVKICDFGMARVAATMGFGPDSDGGGGSINFVGPICWMAPESLQPVKGQVQFSFKTDVYMFGITLWELLSRDIPYAGISTQDVGRRVIAENLRPPKVPLKPSVKQSIEKLLELHNQQNYRSEKPTVAKLLVNLMEQCWSKDPKDRPTMQMVNEELQTMLMQI